MMPLTEGFLAWRAWSSKNPDIAGKLLGRTCLQLSEERGHIYQNHRVISFRKNLLQIGYMMKLVS
jgi:hypothetical protein